MRPYLIGLAVGVGLLALAAVGGLWWIDHQVAARIAAPIAVPVAPVTVPRDSAARVEGARLAWLLGCHGCHGDSLEGRIFVDEPGAMRLVAPNVTQAIQAYADDELARLVRHGVTRTGRAVFAMPSAGYYHLDDADLGRLIAHLRATTVREDQWPATELRFFGRLALLRGDLPRDAESMDHRAPRLGAQRDTTLRALGVYRATTICTECHGMQLTGQDGAPGLAFALGYTLPQFTALLLDGRARDGRDLGLMARTARRRFVRLSSAEIEGIWTYLRAMTPEVSR